MESDFKLERTCRKPRKDVTQVVGKTVGQHFEMEEETGMMRHTLQEEFKYLNGAGYVEVERAVTEFELSCAAGEKSVEGGEDRKSVGRKRV